MRAAEIKQLMEICALGMSILIALLLVLNLRKGRKHIYAWCAAWLLISIRTYISLYEPLPLFEAFLRDLMIVLSDLFFFVGIAYLLELGLNYRFLMPTTFFFLHTGISGLLYLFFENPMYGATFTNLFSNPVLLFVVFYFFNEGGVKTDNSGLRIIAVGFLIWGMDFAIFGPLYYGAGYVFAGMLGWTIGFIARLIIFMGFLLLLPKKR